MERPRSPILSCLRASLPRLNEILQSHPSYGRTALARTVCEVFGFYSATGKLRTASSLQALTALEREWTIELTPSVSRPGRPNARVLSDPVASPTDVPDRIGELNGLRIERVRTREALALWNTLMADEHPLGVTKFADIQKKYLVLARKYNSWLV